MAEALAVPADQFALVRNWAVALELLHNATLIHDDLQDGDHVRRGQPTVWARFGANAAINSGDFLLTLGPLAIDEGIDESYRERLLLHQIYCETAAQLVNGQMLEFEMSGHLDDTSLLEKSYWRCIELKTSALFLGAVRGVAGIAQLDWREASRLEELVKNLGALFQIQDDLVDIFGDKQRAQSACDLREGKVSCLVVNHLKIHPGESAELTKHLRTPRETIAEESVEYWTDRFRLGGALAMALGQIEERRRHIALVSRNLTNPALRALVSEVECDFLKPIEKLLSGRPFHV